MESASACRRYSMSKHRLQWVSTDKHMENLQYVKWLDTAVRKVEPGDRLHFFLCHLLLPCPRPELPPFVALVQNINPLKNTLACGVLVGRGLRPELHRPTFHIGLRLRLPRRRVTPMPMATMRRRATRHCDPRVAQQRPERRRLGATRKLLGEQPESCWE